MRITTLLRHALTLLIAFICINSFANENKTMTTEQMKNIESELNKTYDNMYKGMVNKDLELLDEVLADDFVLVHMTGREQDKNEFLACVENGDLTYFEYTKYNATVEIIDENTGVLNGKNYVKAAVFGGATHTWQLQQICTMSRVDGEFKIHKAVASVW